MNNERKFCAVSPSRLPPPVHELTNQGAEWDTRLRRGYMACRQSAIPEV